MGRLRTGWGLLALAGASAAQAQPVQFTGNVLVDFPAGQAGIMRAIDPPMTPDVGVIVGVAISGWDINEIRVAYDPASDILYVGFQTFGIAGDADGDGDPGRTSGALGALQGLDLPDLAESETIALAFDLDQDGILDVVAGVPAGADITGFEVATYEPGAQVPGTAFDTRLDPHIGAIFASPSAAQPHLEFTILDFSLLPVSGVERGAGFGVRGFAGSFVDGGIGEDFVPGAQTVINLCPTPDGPEVCNDFDDDCDGGIDEDFDVGDVCTVGQGICARDGLIVCDGLAASRCNAVAGAAGVETCNGLDDDCDGRTDENFQVGEVCTVGVGACAVDSVFVCDGPNARRCDALAGVPSGDICDDIDNDCDGFVDEDFDIDEVCVVGVGICRAEGVRVCVGTEASACSVEPGASASESCNNLDDDCDGRVDEGLVGAECLTGRPGTCDLGRDTCVAGAFECLPLVANVPEVCDGLDNDCDGLVDETFSLGMECELDNNGCLSSGVQVCLPDGQGGCNAVPRLPTQEICNAIDDDCDGRTDEGFDLGGTCVAGLGECATDGVRGCDGAGLGVCVPNAPPPPPVPELCDRLDNDCDGRVDEDFGAGDACAVGVGACRREAVIACNEAGEPVCDVAPGLPGTETCNAIDDDCDGRIDEGFAVGEVCAEGQGVCRREGSRACGDDGALVCDAVPGPPNTGDLCEPNLDDDCDGVVDEADDCQGLGSPDQGVFVTGTGFGDNFGCDVTAARGGAGGGSGPGPHTAGLLALLALGGWRRRKARILSESTQGAGGGRR